jgi:hypothetical protein
MFHPLHYRHRYYLGMDVPPASVASVLLGSPVESPRSLPWPSICCCSPQVSRVSGAPDQVSDDEFPIPCQHVIAPPRPSACNAATLPADSDDEVSILRFSRCTAVISCYGDAAVANEDFPTSWKRLRQMHASKQKSELPRLERELLLKQQLPDEPVSKFLADLCTLSGQYRDGGGCISEPKLLSLAVLLRPLSLQQRFLSRAPVFLAFPPLLPTPPPIDCS